MRDAKRLGALSPYDPKYIAASTLLSANENPGDVPDEVRQAVLKRLTGQVLNRYPQPSSDALRGLIAQNLANIVLPTAQQSSEAIKSFPMFGPDSIVVGNGGDELLFNTFLAFGGPGNSVLLTPPSFSVYDIDAQVCDTPVVQVPRKDDFTVDQDAVLQRAAQDDVNVVIITSPNNPTGDCVSNDFVDKLCDATNALVLVDEAYGEFSQATCIPLIQRHENLCVLRTFSKAYSLAGVRLGYIVANPKVIARYLMVRQPYSVDVVSQVIGEEVCKHCRLYAPIVRDIITRRDQLLEKLSCFNGLEVFPSRSNFIMVRTKSAHNVWKSMVYDDSVLVRDFSSQRYLEGCLRITVGTEDENQRMLDALASAIMKGL